MTDPKRGGFLRFICALRGHHIWQSWGKDAYGREVGRTCRICRAYQLEGRDYSDSAPRAAA